MIVTSNWVVQDWGKYLCDMTMAVSILDRPVRRAHLLKLRPRAID